MDWLVQLYVAAHAYFYSLLREFHPRDWGDWLYLIYVPIALWWIGYQFNRLRGRGDKEFDDWVESQARKMRKNLGEERTYYVDWLHDHSTLPRWRRVATATLARLKLIALFILRIVLVRRRRPSVAHAMTLWRAGSRTKAKKELERVAADLETKLPTFAELEQAKRLEARNAFMYVGRVAEEEGQRSVSRSAFDKMLELSKPQPQTAGDPDAHREIALQYLEANNGQAALPHCEKIVSYARGTSDELLEAEGYRLQARAHGIHTRPARKLLGDSLRIERARDHHAGWGATQELFGDIYAPRSRNRNAAVTWYTESREHYRQAGDSAGERRVAKKLNDLLGAETRLSRMLDRLGKFILRLATRMRGPPQM